MHTAANQNYDDAFLSCQDVAAVTGLGKTTIYRFINEGSFPKPVKVGRSSRWLRSRVQAWIRKTAGEQAA